MGEHEATPACTKAAGDASVDTFTIEVEATASVCPVGEATGKKRMAEGKIPVISCEGGCIRGEIARLAANLVAKEEPFARGCHAELFTAPHTAMAKWALAADKVVVIDGCFMQCHGRIVKRLIAEEHLAFFDALAVYKKHTDVMDIDAVTEAERKELARQVADSVLAALKS